MTSGKRIALVCLAAIGVAGGFLGWLGLPSEPVYELHTVRYGFEVRNPTGEIVPDAALEVMIPLAETPFQKRAEIQVDKPWTMVDGQGDAPRIRIRLGDVIPWDTVRVQVEVAVALSDRPVRSVQWESDRSFSTPERWIEADAPVWQTVVDRTKDSSTEETFHQIVRWAGDHLQARSYKKTVSGALRALETGEGDCTEFAFLTAAIARHHHWPTVPVAGFVLPALSAQIRAEDYHNWVYILRDKWWLVDAYDKVVSDQHQRYVAFSVMRPGRNASTDQRFSLSDPRLKARML